MPAVISGSRDITRCRTNRTRWTNKTLHEWTGNVEGQDYFEVCGIPSLKNIPEDIRHDIITVNDLPEKVRHNNHLNGNATSAGTLKSMMNEYEKEIIIKVLKKYRGNKKIVVRTLGINMATLYRKIHKYGIEEIPG